MGELNEKDWRKLCELAAKETDSHKLRQLLQLLVEALDARAKKLSVHSDTSNAKGSLARKELGNNE